MREFHLSGKKPFSPFGWTGPVSVEEEMSVDFTASLPPGPLRAHLASLMALYVFEQKQELALADAHLSPLTAKEQAEGMAQRLSVFEQHLREIATFTRLDPVQARRIVESVTQPKAPRPRREFKRKERNE